MGHNRGVIRWKWWTEFAVAPQVEKVETTEKAEQEEVAKQKEVTEYEQ